MHETSQLHVLSPFPRFYTVPEYKLVRDFHALIVFVRAVKRSQKKKRIQYAKEDCDEERGREQMVLLSRRRHRVFMRTADAKLRLIRGVL